MATLKVITGIAKEKPDYAGLHINAYIRLLGQCQEGLNKEHIPSLVYHGVKFINHSSTEECTSDELIKRFSFFEYVKGMIGLLTPEKLMQIFPPTKEYDGHKYSCKDYFSTMEVIREHGLNKPIGKEIDNILWGYMNGDLMLFVVTGMGLLSNIRRLDGEPGLMEQFAADNELALSTVHTDLKGRMFLTDGKTGEVKRVYKKHPRYLKIVN